MILISTIDRGLEGTPSTSGPDRTNPWLHGPFRPSRWPLATCAPPGAPGRPLAAVVPWRGFRPPRPRMRLLGAPGPFHGPSYDGSTAPMGRCRRFQPLWRRFHRGSGFRTPDHERASWALLGRSTALRPDKGPWRRLGSPGSGARLSRRSLRAGEARGGREADLGRAPRVRTLAHEPPSPLARPAPWDGPWRALRRQGALPRRA